MKSIEFLYWLQGWFEIENPETISAKQVRIIKTHISLVLKYEELQPSTVDKNLSVYIYAIKGILDAKSLEDNALNLVTVKFIKKTLSDVFVHEIDNSYKSDKESDAHVQDTLNTIHNSYSSPSEPGVFRC